jgi:site-specific DNA-methyltransferase (adenine-specific)
VTEKVIIGDAELWHADCRDVLPTLGRFDLLLTDPPYGIGQSGGVFRDRKGGGHRVLERISSWDKSRPSKLIFDLIIDKSSAAIIWGGNYFADFFQPSRGWLYWDKMMGGDYSDGELAWTNMDMVLKHFKYCNKEHGKQHPTQKPTALIEWCLSHAPNSVTVFDPFMGSGTTGVACANLGRKFTGIERERKYFDIACERIARAQAQGKLFAEEALPNPEQMQMAL